MDTGYNERNRQQTLRLKELRRLSDEELSCPVGQHWTVSVALAHIQYWDSRAVGALEGWRRHNLPLTLWISGEDVVNDVRLPVWRGMAPREALQQAIETANVLDRIVESLSPAEARVVSAQRYRVLDRSLHRSEHLDEIDAALGIGPGSCASLREIGQTDIS